MPKYHYTIPTDWHWARLQEICEQDRNIIDPQSSLAETLTYLGLEHIESSTGQILRKPFEHLPDEVRSATFTFDDRHILFGKLRPYLNKVALPDFEGRCSTEIIPILPRDVDREFLAWILRRKETVDAVMQEKTGSRMPRANMNRLFELDIPLPPLPEQRRIAARLNEQMAAAAQARKSAEEQLQAAQALSAAYLREVFESNKVKEAPLRPFGFFVNNFDGKRIPIKSDDRKKRQGKYPYYGASGIIDTIDGYLFDGDYLLIGEDGANLLARSTPIAFRASGKFWVNNHAHVVQPKPMVLLDYLLHFFAVTDLKKYVTGAAQPKLTQDALNSIPVPLLSLDDQRMMVEHLNAKIAETEKLQVGLETQLAEIDRLPSALLREAFRGEL